MKIILKILLIIFFTLMSLKGQAQYWVRADITMSDADNIVDALIQLQIRINGNNIIDLEDEQNGNFNENGPRATVNQAYAGSFPNQVQFFDSTSGFSIATNPAPTGLCYNGTGGSSTNNVSTNGSLFFGPFDGGNSTYFGCDDILESGQQFFQVWQLNDLPQPNEPVCIEESIVLNPGNFGASIRSILYNTDTMPSEQTLINFFPNLVSSYTVDLNTIPNIETASIVRFRLDYGNNIFSNFAIYTLTGCSPEIIDLQVNNPDCADGEGTFTVTFDRPLDANNNEMLTNIGIYIDDGDGILNNLGSLDVFDAPSPNFDTYTGVTYTYPESLLPGGYFFSYQTDNNNIEEISDFFEITAPPPLEYEVEIVSEISCFEENDGSVMITIDPTPSNGSIGAPPYFYTMNGGNLIPFTNTTSTTISGLGTEQLELKVFDNNGCTERMN